MLHHKAITGKCLGAAVFDHGAAAALNRFTQIKTRSNSSLSASTDYQYMQNSKLRSTYFQRSLPRLAIPKLEQTCERYLKAIQPIVSEQEFKHTQEMMAAFQSGEGTKLNELLVQHDAQNKHTSYITDMWFNMYLSDRAPLPLNYNPLLVLKNDTRKEYSSQLVRTSNLIISSLRFWKAMQANKLEPEVFHLNPKKSDNEKYRMWMSLAPAAIATYASYVFKAYPLDMSQYLRLFGVSRVPKLGKDQLVQHSDSRHIVVMRRGHMYAVDVIDANGNIEQPNVIMGRIKAVLDMDSQRDACAAPLGVLTTGNRDAWAKTREHLIANNANKKLLEDSVDSALFCVCLDSADDPVYNESEMRPMLKNMLAGEGKNRWFDKSVSLIVAVDGTAAVNFEHSWGDGVAVLRYFNEIYNETITSPYVNTSSAAANNNASAVRALDFQVDQSVIADIETAKQKNSQILSKLNMDTVRYPNLNRRSCKKARISPDSVMQLAFQLAYRQAFGGYVGSYESCSTAAFKHGRTETIRPCTMTTKQFCEAMMQGKEKRPSNAELRQMLDDCSKTHGALTKNAAMGQGFDRHLFALKHTAQVNNLPIPELYSSKPYAKLNYNIISTSTLSSNALEVGCFGPVVQDGLGIGYSIQNDECGSIVTYYEGSRDGKLFIDSLADAFVQIQNVLANGQ